MTPVRGLSAVSLVVSFFAVLTGIALAYTLAYLLWLFIFGNRLWVSVARHSLEVRYRGGGLTFVVGDSYPEEIQLQNRSRLPLPYCEVSNRHPLPGQEHGRVLWLAGLTKKSWTTASKFTHRGRFAVGPTTISVGDPFGLFQHSWEITPAAEVTVYPCIYPIGELFSSRAGLAFGETAQGRPRDLPPDVATVRKYDNSDGIRRIHWRSSAKVGRLMSRSFDSRQSSDLHLLLDLRAGVHAGKAPESSLEYAVSLAASIADARLRGGAAVSLHGNDAAATLVALGRGSRQRARIMDALALAQDDGRETIADLIFSLAHSGPRGAFCVITADSDPRWCQELLLAKNQASRHQVIYIDPISFGSTKPPLLLGSGVQAFGEVWTIHRGDSLSISRSQALVAS